MGHGLLHFNELVVFFLFSFKEIDSKFFPFFGELFEIEGESLYLILVEKVGLSEIFVDFFEFGVFIVELIDLLDHSQLVVAV